MSAAQTLLAVGPVQWAASWLGLSDRMLVVVAGTIFSAIGMWLLLPGRHIRSRLVGALVGLIGLGLLASLAVPLGGFVAESLFWLLASVTVIAAAATVSLRSPVYCAIWFALSLLGTAGLFLFQGAQFLGVATVVVYAGAILVTFLFVLMLAQPEGHAYYDRISWEGMLSSVTGAVLVGLLTMTISNVYLGQSEPVHPEPTEILASEHVAHLGGQLFSRHLVSVEVAGTLLLVALVGSIAIVAHDQRPTGDKLGAPRAPEARR